ncbi:uncharacterized protein KRP23_2949 [Phytophthora ramorum]|uniref:uncharacterized protein n=1 Tax=Phytophthora ramorum TaxID=164328 RepID=UPI00309AEF82|nr:hypothetical protein KRP23_2949 [Phytophthora ramorum]
MIDCLQSFSSAASFRGTLFALDVHEKLDSGSEVIAQELGGTDTSMFNSKTTSPGDKEERYCNFDSDFSASGLANGPYHVSSASPFVSIDSFYRAVRRI